MKLRTCLNRQVFLYIIGISVLSLGIRFIIDSNLGAAPWDLLSIGLSDRTNVSIGTWQIMNNILMIVATKLIFKKKWNILCLVPGVLQGLCIDIFASCIHVGNDQPYFVLIIGCALSAIGLTIYINQGLSANAIDNFTYMLHKEKGMKMSVCKVVCDSIPLIIILIITIQIQVATLLVYVLVPLFMYILQKIMPRNLIHSSLSTNER